MYSGQTRNSSKEDLGALFSIPVTPGGFQNVQKWHCWENTDSPLLQGAAFSDAEGR